MAARRPPEPVAPRAGRRPKAEAIDARAALLRAATQLFAEQGVAETTTREICTAAGLNPGAIHYHFGDKDGLYRAVLLGPLEALRDEMTGFDDPALPLREALARVLMPFMCGDDADPLQEAVMRLFHDEIHDPSPVFAQAFRDVVAPLHQALSSLLARHIGVAGPNTTTHQLAYALQAAAHDYSHCSGAMELMSPGWLDAPGSFDAVRERLVEWGLVLVEHERRKHQSAPPPAAKSPKKKTASRKP
jgi:AcrR family transcriptional regulator